MNSTKEVRIVQLEARLSRLRMNAGENVNLIRKVNRQLRKLRAQ